PPEHAEHGVELRPVRAVDADGALEDEVLRLRCERRVRLHPPGALDEHRLALRAAVDERVGAREAGLAAEVDVEDRDATCARRGDDRLELRDDAPLLDLGRQHAADAPLADVRLVHDVVLHLDDAERRAAGVEEEVGRHRSGSHTGSVTRSVSRSKTARTRMPKAISSGRQWTM